MAAFQAALSKNHALEEVANNLLQEMILRDVPIYYLIVLWERTRLSQTILLARWRRDAIAKRSAKRSRNL